jgi:hypothetical protein
MSNGINAIKGFDYQATVILDRLFDHFEHNGPEARVRPEGADDLDLSWTKDAVEHRQYEQIKKPREDNQGNRTPKAWSLSEVVEELLPNTIAHLSGNDHKQVWIVGDEVNDEVRSLLGSQSYASLSDAYCRALHLLARRDAIDAPGLDQALRSRLLRWQPPDNLSTTADALLSMTHALRNFVQSIGAPGDVADRYQTRAADVHTSLPGVLARTQILPLYGTEPEVVKRVYDRLEQRYGLRRSVIESTLFRNLRGFINDISKEPNRSFDQAELEFELRTVWPHMIPVKSPPLLQLDHVGRPDLTERFTTRWTGKAIEAVGISGSGKTMLTAAGYPFWSGWSNAQPARAQPVAYPTPKRFRRFLRLFGALCPLETVERTFGALSSICSRIKAAASRVERTKLPRRPRMQIGGSMQSKRQACGKLPRLGRTRRRLGRGHDPFCITNHRADALCL